ncbi:glycoside hydrolase family 55 protein [Ancylothrix sp. C2]|uniref:glycoside hydrolase family 55 protein n=1 Tax=Ancylothrix sp. D3o TaxID=2953691 RepID=UPI0021BB8CB2|nr:glycoside hydrolase family 55 protein [Ancylothrix sp. D3o]MCT7949045.1 glycoside hydrolase family 55 protein [Ancylothrix sp. D3o]
MKKNSRKRLLIAAILITLIVGIYSLWQGYNYLSAQEANPNQISQNCGSKSAGPTDNPIAGYYGNTPYAWTNQIKWNCVYNIKDFPAGSTIESFNAARDAAEKNGGGVVYFPPGIYNFSDNIYLKNGVVLRGDAANVKEAKAENYNLPSQLIFPKYEPNLTGAGTPNNTAFKKIYTTNPNTDSNIGLVNLDINRAGVYWEADIDNGKNKNILIFGIRNNNVADFSPNVPNPEFQEAWMRYSHRFAANLKINALENILVANNRINDKITDNYDQPAYKIQPLKGSQILTLNVPFNYTNHYGISVNRSKPKGFSLAADPQSEPGLFRKGIVIRDNWVYHTMRVAIQASGDGLILQNNIIKDQANKQWWTDPTGTKQAQNSVTLENRAIDWSGWNVKIEGNDYEVYRHQIADAKYLSVDGEGILIQECCGGTKVKGAILSKNSGNSYIGFYKVPGIENVEITQNKLLTNITNTPLIFVMADTNKTPHRIDNVKIENNVVNGSILAQGSLGGNNNIIQNNTGNNTGNIETNCHVSVKENPGFEVKQCKP